MFVCYRSFCPGVFAILAYLTRLYMFCKMVKWLKALILKDLFKIGRKSPRQLFVTNV